jgi:cGMP-dependent protein kinase
MTICTYSHGQVVIPKGTAKGTALWIILMGSLGSSEVEAKTGSCLGDEDLVGSREGVYQEDVLAQGKDVHIAQISLDELETCIGGSLLHATANNEAISVLKRVQLLRGLPSDRFRLLVTMLETREYQPDTVIVQQNDPGDCFFILKTGQVSVIRNGVSIRVVSKLDYFGERAMLFEEFRSATVVATGHVSCWVLQKKDFLRILTDTMRKRLIARIDLQDDNIALRDLIIVKLLGKGMFGNVFLASHPQKEVLYALKTVTRAKVDQYNLHENLFLEKNVLMQLDHVFIVSLVKTFKDEKRFYFLMEFVKGMDLFDALRKIGLLSDDDSRFYVAALMLMMEHLHERNIIYRDLKPENVMVDEEGYPKLIDFGTAKIVANRTYTVIGTPHYMAPEVILGKGYNTTVDFYGIGVLLYEFISGKVPFGESEEDPYDIYQKVLEHRLVYPDFLDSKFPAKALIEQLLNSNPAMRTGGGIEQLKAHRWFNGFDWVNSIQDRLYSRELRPPYTPGVSNINREVAIARVKRPTIDVIAVNAI